MYRCFLEPNVVQRRAKWLQQWNRKENKFNKQIVRKMNIEFYRFGMRFVSMLETKRFQNGRQIGSQLHITWNRLNMQQAETQWVFVDFDGLSV